MKRLGKIDVSTGNVEYVGATPTFMTDIAFAPDGTLYGITGQNLFEINPLNAAVSFVGAHGIAGLNALVFGADGTLYSAGFQTSLLYTIDTSTGTATDIGDIGFMSSGDLAFSDGEFYMSSTNDKLIRIDLQNNSQGASVGSFGFSDVYGLATAGDGTLYGVSDTTIISVNTSTGMGTLVSAYANTGPFSVATGLSFQGATTVPEPASAGIFASLLCLTMTRRSRRTESPDHNFR